MSTQAIEMIAVEQENTAERSPNWVYAWTYLFFTVLTVLAVYVMFTFPQGDI